MFLFIICGGLHTNYQNPLKSRLLWTYNHFLNPSRFVGFSVEFFHGCFPRQSVCIELCVTCGTVHGSGSVHPRLFQHQILQALAEFSSLTWDTCSKKDACNNSKHNIISDTVVTLTTFVMTVHEYFVHFH